MDLNSGISLLRNHSSFAFGPPCGEPEAMERIFQIQVFARVAKASRDVFFNTVGHPSHVFVGCYPWNAKILQYRYEKKINDISNDISFWHYTKIIFSSPTLLFQEEDHTGHGSHLDVEMQGSMRLFRAQRNFYISGFALFLSLVIRRLVILISSQAALLAQSEASMRQAQSATMAAKSLLANKEGEDAQNESNEAHDVEVSWLWNNFMSKFDI